MKDFKFELGVTVKETITGFTGIIRGQYRFLTGCDQYGVQSPKMKDNKPEKWQTFDEGLLVLVPKGKKIKLDKKILKKNPGGPLQNHMIPK